MISETYNNLKIINALNTALINSDTTTNGIVIDTLGFESLTFVVKMGVLTDGDYLPLIEESDTDFSGSAVADADLIGTEAGAGFTADNEDQDVSKIGYKGTKRYVRLSIVSTNNGGSGATLGALAILGHARENPQSTQKIAG